MQDHGISNYCNTANLVEPYLGYWTSIFLHPTAPGFLLPRPCYHLVLFLSSIVSYRFWTRGLVFELPSWGLNVLLHALQTLARVSAFSIKEYAHALCYQQTHSLHLKMLLDPHNRQHLPKLEKRFTRNRKQTAVTNIIHRNAWSNKNFLYYLTFRMLQHTSSEVNG